MAHSKALDGLSMHDLREWCKTHSSTQTIAKTLPSDIELKKWLVELSGTDIAFPDGTKLRDAVQINATRQGIDGTTIPEQYASNMYDYSLLKLGVHVGSKTAFPKHCSANELAFKKTTHRGGRTGGLFQNTADAIFIEGVKSDTGFVKVSYGSVSQILSVVPPTFFVGAKTADTEIAPDVMWGQMMKDNDIAAQPAVQLSEQAQQLIVSLKREGLNDKKLKDLRIEAATIDDLIADQRQESADILHLRQEGQKAAEWAASHVARSARKR